MNREALLRFFYQGVHINLVMWELCGNQATGGDSLFSLNVGPTVLYKILTT